MEVFEWKIKKMAIKAAEFEMEWSLDWTGSTAYYFVEEIVVSRKKFADYSCNNF